MEKRTIKFRAWDKENKRMRNGGFWVGSDFGEVYTVALETPIEELNKNRAIIERDSSLIPMQFTGLTDKNGKEIWEGDIVKDDDNIHEGVREVRFGEEFIDASDYEQYCVGMIGFYLTNYLNNVYEFEGLTSEKAKHLEVIGNIYENPELLK